MTVIRQDDVIQSVADALQYISYYHPKDFIDAMAAAYEREENPAAKDAIAQILINSRMCATGHRPICQDTGIVTVFVHVGMNVTWDAEMSLDDMVNEGVRRAYQLPDNVLRASVLADPDGKRQNTKDNTPAIIHHKIVPGDKVDIHVAAKGGGSEAKSKFAMLNPSDSVVDWVMEQLPKMGAGWCPPGMLGIGIGGTAEKAMEIANEQELDLVEISPKADPPVCKVIDYKKFLYEQKKRDKAMKAKASKVVVKEIRFGPQTDDHDYEFKKRHAEKFLKDGAKLKAYVFFKGRSIVYKDQGEILLLRLAQELEELGKVEQMPKLEGKRMTMFIAPKTNKK